MHMLFKYYEAHTLPKLRCYLNYYPLSQLHFCHFMNAVVPMLVALSVYVSPVVRVYVTRDQTNNTLNHTIYTTLVDDEV